jgi:hypothetical protein
MATAIRRVDYFYAAIQDEPGEGYRILAQLAELGVNLLAFVAVPVGPMRTQITLFPDDTHKLKQAATQAGLTLDGPHRALLVQGDDHLGALAGIHEKLADAKVNIYASNAVADGKGNYGYVLYVRPEKYDRAAAALGL